MLAGRTHVDRALEAANRHLKLQSGRPSTSVRRNPRRGSEEADIPMEGPGQQTPRVKGLFVPTKKQDKQKHKWNKQKVNVKNLLRLRSFVSAR